MTRAHALRHYALRRATAERPSPILPQCTNSEQPVAHNFSVYFHAASSVDRTGVCSIASTVGAGSGSSCERGHEVVNSRHDRRRPRTDICFPQWGAPLLAVTTGQPLVTSGLALRSVGVIATPQQSTQQEVGPSPVVDEEERRSAAVPVCLQLGRSHFGSRDRDVVLEAVSFVKACRKALEHGAASGGNESGDEELLETGSSVATALRCCHTSTLLLIQEHLLHSHCLKTNALLTEMVWRALEHRPMEATSAQLAWAATLCDSNHSGYDRLYSLLYSNRRAVRGWQYVQCLQVLIYGPSPLRSSKVLRGTNIGIAGPEPSSADDSPHGTNYARALNYFLYGCLTARELEQTGVLVGCLDVKKLVQTTLELHFHHLDGAVARYAIRWLHIRYCQDVPSRRHHLPAFLTALYLKKEHESTSDLRNDAVRHNMKTGGFADLHEDRRILCRLRGLPRSAVTASLVKADVELLHAGCSPAGTQCLPLRGDASQNNAAVVAALLRRVDGLPALSGMSFLRQCGRLREGLVAVTCMADAVRLCKGVLSHAPKLAAVLLYRMFAFLPQGTEADGPGRVAQPTPALVTERMLLLLTRVNRVEAAHALMCVLARVDPQNAPSVWQPSIHSLQQVLAHHMTAADLPAYVARLHRSREAAVYPMNIEQVRFLQLLLRCRRGYSAPGKPTGREAFLTGLVERERARCRLLLSSQSDELLMLWGQMREQNPTHHEDPAGQPHVPTSSPVMTPLRVAASASSARMLLLQRVTSSVHEEVKLLRQLAFLQSATLRVSREGLRQVLRSEATQEEDAFACGPTVQTPTMPLPWEPLTFLSARCLDDGSAALLRALREDGTAPPLHPVLTSALRYFNTKRTPPPPRSAADDNSWRAYTLLCHLERREQRTASHELHAGFAERTASAKFACMMELTHSCDVLTVPPAGIAMLYRDVVHTLTQRPRQGPLPPGVPASLPRCFHEYAFACMCQQGASAVELCALLQQATASASAVGEELPMFVYWLVAQVHVMEAVPIPPFVRSYLSQ